MSTVIIGAGLAGLSAAYHLRKNWVIFEKDAKVGGLSRSDRVNGFIFDKTGHLFHVHSAYTKKWLVDGLLKNKLHKLDRNSWIFSKDVFTRYPFQANTYGLERKTMADCVVSFLKTRDRRAVSRRNQNFKQWCLATFGPGISRHFMLPYNRKLWRTDLDKVTTEWLGGFIPVPSREEVVYGALVDQKKFFGYNASFYYPKEGGSQTLADAVSRQLCGSELYLNSEVAEIHWQKKEIVTSQGLRRSYDRLINTGPLNVFLERLRPRLDSRLEAAGREALRYNVVYNLNLGITNPRPTDKHWVYFPEKRFPFYRIGVLSNFASSVAPKGMSSFYIEFVRLEREGFDYEKMQNHAIETLKTLSWMKPDDEIAHKQWLRIAPAYVIYTKERARFLPQIFNFLQKHDIFSIGRYGAWKYSFMEQALLDGKAAAQTILGSI
ncbi:MAG: FAD-dependent oxidoreductase [Elusimicrobia bacterium]|nr:FAD-dependent oxidoreductase [Elusimicrobiota bacterium]